MTFAPGLATTPPVASESEVDRPEPPPAGPSDRTCSTCAIVIPADETFCPQCRSDEGALDNATEAQWELRALVGYVRLMNHSAEGRIYLKLISESCHGALMWAHNRADLLS